MALGLLAALTVVGCGGGKRPAGEQGDPSSDGDTPPRDAGRGKSDAKTSSSSSGSTGRGAKDDSGTTSEPAPTTAVITEPIEIDHCGDDNPAAASAADIAKLKASGAAGGLKWLYPYEGTVFPRGMIAPDLMWDGPSGEVAYVHIKSKIFEYWGCVKPDSEGRIALAQDVWEKAGQRSGGKQDSYEVELSVLNGGKVTGPARSSFQIAQAPIKGSIYYNTYASKLLTSAGGAAPGGGLGGLFGLPGVGGAGGVVVRIPAGGRAEVFGQTDCNGCHSVSADGSRLLAESAGNGAYSYSITTNGPAPMPTGFGGNALWTALYPDGSVFMTMSTAVDVARTQAFGGLIGAADAALFDATTGAEVQGKSIPKGALMPAFSPDGTHLVFNDFAIGQAHGLGITKYDTATHTASDYVELFNAPGARRPGWPFFLPDNHGVVFINTESGDFTGGGIGIGGGVLTAGGAPYSELSIVDVESKQVTVLAKAMGYDTPDDAQANKTYLPFGEADLHHTYYPTVSPVASGGYFWVFFDSIRNYGNLGLQRQLWGAAIDISPDGNYQGDPSHPAFYLSGQEAGAGNHRAFAALDACHADGDACTSGIDCCGGFCYIDAGNGEFSEPVGSCSPEKAMCSKRDERCAVDADCCPPAEGEPPHSCIAGFCAYVPII